MCRRASVCPRVRGARAYRDTPGDEFGVFTDVLSRARAPGDDRSGNTPIFAIPISPSGFSRLGLLGPYPSYRARLTFRAPLVPPRHNSTAVKCSAAKPAFVEKVEKAGKAAFGGLAALTLAAGVRYSIKSFPRLVQPYPRFSGRVWSANASNRHGTTAIGPAHVSTRGAGTPNASHPPVRGVSRPRSSGFFFVLTTRVPRARGHDLQNQQ